MKKATVLGAYGFIGAACVRALRERGYAVTCIGRSLKAARTAFPDAKWIQRDIAHTAADDWRPLFQDTDVVVNATGALQDGARDDLAAIHRTAVERICEALAGTGAKLIQISAAGVSEQSPTDFFRTKAEGDARIRASDIDWVILRPVLVLGPQAYGGTALLRAAAAMPGFGPGLFPGARIETVHVEDVARAVVQAAEGELGWRFTADLTEDGTRSFSELLLTIRSWLGYPPWRAVVTVPGLALTVIARCADALGWFGWRSPFRTNAIRSLEDGITGDRQEWRRRGGVPIRSLNDTLQSMPATAQERLFARMYLLLPAAIGCLSLFWLASGLIGLASHEDAMTVLTDTGTSARFAAIAVFGGAAIDIALGLGVLIRRWTRPSCAAMLAVSVVYLLGGTVLTPHLWADPLGPLVKVLAAMMLALIVALVMEER